MSNRIGRSYSSLVQLLPDAQNGVETHGTAVGLKHITAALLLAAKEDLIGKPAGPNNTPPAVPGKQFLWTVAKAGRLQKAADLRNECSNGRALASACINALKPTYGARYSAKWQAIGLTGHSLAAPDNPVVMLQELWTYFLNNPGRELPTAQPYAITAAACAAAVLLIEAAQAASNQSDVAAGKAQKDYETAMNTAHDLLCDLRAELSRLLSDDDERWYAFGFDRPCDPDRLAEPEKLNVIQGAPGSRMLIAHWRMVRDADNFRLRAVNHATGEVVAEVIVSENDAVLRDLPANITVDITVTARTTDGGESPASPPFTIAVP